MYLAAIIGDIVGSKEVADRDALQQRFLETLEIANRTTSPTTRLRITRGDEFEGSYQTIEDAWTATLRLHLLMRQRGHQLWLSVAWGEVTAQPGATDAATQDGPAWWAAREALTHLKQSSRIPRHRRSVFTPAGAVSAAAILRDEVLARLDEADATITLGLLDGLSQAELAATLDVTPGVVSRRTHRNGLRSLAESARISP